MLMIMLILGSAALVSALTVWIVIKVGPIDRPNARSSHVHPVPKGGGLGPVVVVVAALILATIVLPGSPELWAVLGGSVLVAAMALLDDYANLPPKIKLAVQALAAGLVVACGVSVSQIGPVPLGPFGPALAFCWILYVTNAVNFMDGLNGLVAGVGCIAGAALMGGDGGISRSLGAVMAAGLLGFLPFNYPRARIFLGDVGSQFCGFLLAVLTLTQARENEAAGLIIPLALLVLLFDVGVTLVRRVVARERLTEAHRSHCYQLLHRTGIPAPWVTAGVWALSLWGALCALIAPWPVAIPLALAPCLAWTGWAWTRARRRLETW